MTDRLLWQAYNFFFLCLFLFAKFSLHMPLGTETPHKYKPWT
jgi:hypothetical protein